MLKKSITVGNLNLEPPIGIASSNLTQDCDSIKELKKRSNDFTPGWITIKSISNLTGKLEMRICHTHKYGDPPVIPKSLLARGRNEFITPQKASKISKEIINCFPESKIKISLPYYPNVHGYQTILNKLRKFDAKFDLIEVPCKYLHKTIIKSYRNRREDFFSRSITGGVVVQEFYIVIKTLIDIRKALECAKFEKNFPVIFKLSLDNLYPEYLASFLSYPNHKVFDPLKALIEKLLDTSTDAWTSNEKKRFKDDLKNLEGVDGVIMFDSEKYPIFLPDLTNIKTSFLIGAEEGYAVDGALAGKTIAKDSIKYTYITYDIFSRLTSHSMPKPKILSSGGCDSAFDIISRMIFGASGVEICTAILQNDEHFLSNIWNEFQNYLNSQGFSNLNDVIGLAHQKAYKKAEEYKTIQVDITNCRGCSNCTVYCWHGAMGFNLERKRVVDNSKCVGCTACKWLCQHDIIQFR